MEHPIYCEQPLESGFFEPINTITNLAFMLAGVLLLIRLKKREQLDGKAIFLGTMLIVIGFGSFAWHFYRTSATLWADNIPIMIFVLSFLYFYLAYATKTVVHRWLFFVGFFVHTYAIIALFGKYTAGTVFGNGGFEYMTALSYFIVIQIYNFIHKKELIRGSIVVVALFMVSLFFRQIDLSACDSLSFGTHFMWHIMNAIVLYSFVMLLYPKTK